MYCVVLMKTYYRFSDRHRGSDESVSSEVVDGLRMSTMESINSFHPLRKYGQRKSWPLLLVARSKASRIPAGVTLEGITEWE